VNTEHSEPVASIQIYFEDFPQGGDEWAKMGGWKARDHHQLEMPYNV